MGDDITYADIRFEVRAVPPSRGSGGATQDIIYTDVDHGGEVMYETVDSNPKAPRMRSGTGEVGVPWGGKVCAETHPGVRPPPVSTRELCHGECRPSGPAKAARLPEYAQRGCWRHWVTPHESPDHGLHLRACEATG